MPDGGSDAPRPGRNFEAFYSQRWEELRRALGSATFLGIDPNDVVQDAMIIAREHHQRFASDDELVLWCKRVGLNLIHAQVQTAYRRRESPEPSPADARPIATAIDVEEQAVENAELARVMAMLQPRHAEVLLLDAAGHDNAEIARILKLTPAASRKLLQRAREAARNAWGTFVAAVLLRAARVRKGRQGQSGNTHPLLASVVSVSMVAALVAPHTGPNENATPGPAPAHAATSRAHPVIHTPAVAGQPATTATTATTTATHTVTAPSDQHPDVRTDAPGLIPHVRKVCAPHVCVASSCSPSDQPGDVLYLKADGPCGVSTTENTMPVCQYVAANPVLGCQRRGHPQWSVDPPPPPSPEGEPL